MENESSLPYAQQLATCPCHEPEETRLKIPITFLQNPL
jgi:hypothetical protein